MDPRKISWTSGLKNRFQARTAIDVDAPQTMSSIYRPFNRRQVTTVKELIHRPAIIGRCFPDANAENVGVYVLAPTARTPFSVLAVDAVPDVAVFMDAAQLFARYTYAPRTEAGDDLLSQLAPLSGSGSGYERVDNITDWALADYRTTYGHLVSKDDIFYYVYGILHSPNYRREFAADLKKMLPRIPKVEGADNFRAFATAGRELAGLHIGYEDVNPYPLEETEAGAAVTNPYRVRKMAFGKGKDRSRIIYNQHITLSGIPEEAYEYMLGSRSAVEWIMERYQVKTDKASGIVNDPNDWADEVGDPRYVIDLVKRIVTVSLETMKIVNQLPSIG